MISFLRKGLSSWLVLAILGLVMIAFVITGVNAPGGAPVAGGGERLVSVGDQTVSTVEVADQVNRQFERVRQQQPELDLAAFFQEGAYEEIVRQLIGQKAMLAFGESQGFAASKRLIDGEIAGIPAFQNLAGQFDPQMFQQALRNERITEQQLRDDIAASIIQRQILLPVAAAPVVPQEMALQYASLLLEQRSGSIGLVPAAAVAAGAAPSDAEVAAFYRQNQARYTIPERRVIRYAAIGAEQVAGAAAPTDAEIETFYRANAARYGAKETRTLNQVVLPDQAAARAFAAKLAGGTSFAEAARQAGFSEADTRLENQDKAQYQRLTSAAVANAAFAAAEGAVTAPVQSPLGWHVVRVASINRSAETPLAAVRDEIRTQLQQQKAQEALATLVARVEDALANGASFEEVARAERLQIQETPPLTATGQSPGAAAPPASPEVQALLREAFQMSPDEDPVVETLAPNRYAIVALARVVPAAPPALAQIAEQVRRDLVQQRANERARVIANGIVAKINGGMPAAQAFAGAGVRLPAPEPVSRRRVDIAQPGQQVPPPLAMMFSLPEGKARVLQAPNGGGWFVVHLEEAMPGDAAGQQGLIQATRTQFERIMGEEYAAQFNRAVQAQLEIERDEEAIARTKRQLQSGQPVQ
jgi:peptidyl-prolyl cis-trans isomerase D